MLWQAYLVGVVLTALHDVSESHQYGRVHEPSKIQFLIIAFLWPVGFTVGLASLTMDRLRAQRLK